MICVLRDEGDTAALGRRLAQVCPIRAVIWLHGPLGAGKTTLVRGFLRGLGYHGTVKSPTYTLIEPYDSGGHRVFHLDLYRISHPAELDNLGLRELQDDRAVVLVEWPERGVGALPPADLSLELEYQGTMRRVIVRPLTSTGNELAKAVPGFRAA